MSQEIQKTVFQKMKAVGGYLHSAESGEEEDDQRQSHAVGFRTSDFQFKIKEDEERQARQRIGPINERFELFFFLQVVADIRSEIKSSIDKSHIEKKQHPRRFVGDFHWATGYREFFG